MANIERRDSYFMPGHYAVPVYCNDWLVGSFPTGDLAAKFIGLRRDLFPQNRYSTTPPPFVNGDNSPSRRVTDDARRERQRRAARRAMAA